MTRRIVCALALTLAGCNAGSEGNIEPGTPSTAPWPMSYQTKAEAYLRSRISPARPLTSFHAAPPVAAACRVPAGGLFRGQRSRVLFRTSAERSEWTAYVWFRDGEPAGLSRFPEHCPDLDRT